MPKVSLTADQKSHSIFDTENFKMKTGQKARVLLIESEFEVEFVHWVDDFGYVICHGDYNTMLNEGTDVHCKFCQSVDNNGSVKKARRKFVTLLVVYRTNSKGQILTPISCDVQPWVFGDDKFNDLYGKKEQWGDLRSHDLGIECLGEQYQKFNMNVLPEAVWLKDDETKALVTASFKETKGMYAKDLRMLLGRDVTDPEKIADIISDATGVSVVPDYASTGAIESMFSDTPVSAPAPIIEVDFGAMLDEKSIPPAVETTVMSSTEDPLSSTVEPSGTIDFDELLS